MEYSFPDELVLDWSDCLLFPSKFLISFLSLATGVSSKLILYSRVNKSLIVAI
jgi:hypothetical protein